MWAGLYLWGVIWPFFSLRWSWNHDPFSGWAVWDSASWVGVCFLRLSSMIGSGSVALVSLSSPMEGEKLFLTRRLSDVSLWAQMSTSPVCGWNTVVMVPGSVIARWPRLINHHLSGTWSWKPMKKYALFSLCPDRNVWGRLNSLNLEVKV